jgi:hypothetical protein
MENLLKRRFQELSDQAEKVEASKHMVHDHFSNTNRESIDSNVNLNWKVKAKALLVSACGAESQHFKEFEASESQGWATNLANFRRMRAVFEAAREDFEGGYLTSVHDLVRAEVFGSELEQATELLKSGYGLAAAVIAGVVLETAIRDLCTRNQIQRGKLDKSKRPEFPSGMSPASRPSIPSWEFLRKRDLCDRFAGGERCRRSV